MRTAGSRAAAVKRAANCAAGINSWRAEQHVVRHVELGIDRDAEQAVAAGREAEQLGVLAARAGHHRSVRQHRPERPQRRAEPARTAPASHAR
jgi:hypothetical protein